MGFEAILAQETAVGTLKRALEQGQVHHAYRFEGPDGVGKERAAFALAQALICENPNPLACEHCSACHRAVSFSESPPKVPLHPDVRLLQRGLYPSSLIGAGEANGISVEQVRRIVLSHAAFTPHEGRALVFIIRDAHELTVSAAKELLKILEEPPRSTHFILLSHRPNLMLDTIRSRTFAVRFAPLPEALIRRILTEHGAAPETAEISQGSAALALELADPSRMQEREEFVSAALAALDAKSLAGAISFAEKRDNDRGKLKASLTFLAQRLASEAKTSVASDPDFAERRARQYSRVLGTITELEKNAQPALALEAMIAQLRMI